MAEPEVVKLEGGATTGALVAALQSMRKERDELDTLIALLEKRVNA